MLDEELGEEVCGHETNLAVETFLSLLGSNVLDFNGQVLDYEEQAQMDQVSVALITNMCDNLALCMPAGRDSP